MQYLYILGGRRTPTTEDNKSGFSVTKWLKKVFTNWGIPYNDPCCPATTIQPVGVTAGGVLQIYDPTTGTWSALAETENTDPAITALGVDDTDGYALTKDFNVITGGAANTGVELPTAVVGRAITIANLTASAKKVYANASDAIDDKTATTGFVILQPEDVVTFRAYTVALWQSDFEADGTYSTMFTDTISENTAGAGVTVDGVLLKDGGVTSGGYIASFYPSGVPNSLTGPGAITTTRYLTNFTSTNPGDALTLADGTVHGQMKKIVHVANGGGNTGVLTPDNLNSGTTIEFVDVGQFAILQWNGTEWVVLELGNSVTPGTLPVLA